MSIDAGGAVFGIQEVEYGTPFGEVFLGNDPNGAYLQVWEAKRSSCVAHGNLFRVSATLKIAFFHIWGFNVFK